MKKSLLLIISLFLLLFLVNNANAGLVLKSASVAAPPSHDYIESFEDGTDFDNAGSSVGTDTPDPNDTTVSAHSGGSPGSEMCRIDMTGNGVDSEEAIQFDMGEAKTGFTLSTWVLIDAYAGGYYTSFMCAQTTSGNILDTANPCVILQDQDTTGTICTGSYDSTRACIGDDLISPGTWYRVEWEFSSGTTNTVKVYNEAGSQIGSTATDGTVPTISPRYILQGFRENQAWQTYMILDDEWIDYP